jgi:mercuric ion transport protein
MTRAYCCETDVNQSQANQTPSRAEQGGMIVPTATDRAKTLASMAGSMLGWDQHKLSAQEDAVRRYILAQYPLQGRAPTVREISQAFGLTPDDTKTILQRLQAWDMLGLEPESSLIRLAYPFSSVPTPHAVNFDQWSEAKPVYAQCAIDALGLAFMLHRDLSITSSCASCAKAIAITVRDQTIVAHSPSETVVWAGTIQEGPVEASACPAINFFCSAAHVDGWLQRQPNAAGSVVSLGEALYIGKAIFEPLLVTPSHPSPDPLESHEAGLSATGMVARTSIAGLVAAFLASLCCIGPLMFAVFGVGVGAAGALAGTAGFLKALLPYRPVFVALTLLLLGISFYHAYRKPSSVCATEAACAARSARGPNRKLLWLIAALALVLVLAPSWLAL